jgi:hypothetical protein
LVRQRNDEQLHDEVNGRLPILVDDAEHINVALPGQHATLGLKAGYGLVCERLGILKIEGPRNALVITVSTRIDGR